MAGRIAVMLANGVAPKTITAVTFTELAASELLSRVREFASELAAGNIPAELRIALPNGLSDQQRQHLATANAAIDEISCTTIHGFCQRLIKPYPVEADIDPGAAVMDRDQADLNFIEIIDTWLREVLSSDEGGLIAEMVLQNPGGTVGLIHTILGHLRHEPGLSAEAAAPVVPLVADFQKKANSLAEFTRTARASEEETAECASQFEAMSAGLTFALTSEAPADLVRLLLSEPSPALCTSTGTFKVYKKKGKWGDAAKRAGLSKADGDQLNTEAESHYKACCEAWQAMLQNAASRALADLIGLVQPALQRFRDYKRSTALLDFDDLIFAARGLLRDHESVRQALATRFAHVLVDEFQDTDPLQTEIFWRLCGDPPAGATGDDWTAFRIRPGALFLVGDPKQAIYRFRGADVAAYIQARAAFQMQGPESVLAISTNFRSCAPILGYVNKHFEAPLAVEQGQPGFTALEPFHPERDGGGLCIAALEIAVANDDGKATAEQQRDGEADVVADMCARLIGKEEILDRKTSQKRFCRPGDIALLAPTGSDLWRYEEALERRGIPVATQAGKGLFRRQEIQDLIALTRVLADRRDTLALGAILRGPLVGLTEEELLDIVWALPRAEDAPEALPRFDLGVDPATIAHPHARDIVEKLQTLRLQINSTTPHNLLSQAVDVLRVRPILLQRHSGQAERALANVDLYLNFSRSYAVRGLRAFAEAMTAAWTDESRAVEGRPDAQEEAVALYTMHASKGLEWPIVVPINTMTLLKAPDAAMIDRATRRFYCPVFGVKPIGYEAARDAEHAELKRERIRLWYVATTRARELLVLPRLDVTAKSSAWISLLDLSLSVLPAIDLTHYPPEFAVTGTEVLNSQIRQIFAQQASDIASGRRQLTWLTPSRDEGSKAGPILAPSEPEILISGGDGVLLESSTRPVIQGGRERGLVIHKLLEEVLTGELADEAVALIDRADLLIQALGLPVKESPALGLNPAEIAACISRALALKEIAPLRQRLTAEFPVYSSTMTDAIENATTGVADAIAFRPDGTPEVVVDWKSDVDPAPEMIEHYRGQVSAYLTVTGAERGLIVLVTSGVVIPVAASSSASTV